METKIINGLEFEYDKSYGCYKRDGIRFEIIYARHNYFASCYGLDYKSNFPYAKSMEEVEIKVVKSLYFKISEKYEKYNRLNDIFKDIDRKCFR